jgi:DNA-binding response OmpR family regulator
MTNFQSEKKRVLFVDDHKDTRELLAYQLAYYKLDVACDFAEGLRIARLKYFDLYILDNWLPGGSGVELCRRIREFDPHTPVLFYSAASQPRDAREAMSAGAQKYLVKPVRFDVLAQSVAELLIAANERAFDARRAEISAIREELAIRRKESAMKADTANVRRRRAEEKVLRLKAEMAFLAAGSTRGEFARRWKAVYLKEVRGAGGLGAADPAE